MGRGAAWVAMGGMCRRHGSDGRRPGRSQEGRHRGTSIARRSAKKLQEELEKRKGPSLFDPYFNIVQVTVYGQARFYNPPPAEPQAQPSPGDVRGDPGRARLPQARTPRPRAARPPDGHAAAPPPRRRAGAAPPPRRRRRPSRELRPPRRIRPRRSPRPTRKPAAAGPADAAKPDDQGRRPRSSSAFRPASPCPAGVDRAGAGSVRS